VIKVRNLVSYCLSSLFVMVYITRHDLC
jgi:hypothetical protein